MKFIKNLLASMLVMITFSATSCSESNDPEPVLMDPTVTSLQFSAEGGVQKTQVTLNGAVPDVKVDQAWCDAVVSASNSGFHTIEVTAKANDSYDTRSAVLTISYESSSKTVAISQDALEKTPEIPNYDRYDLGVGWNLGNQLDAWVDGVANETSWGNEAATQATFDAVKAAGFTSVRIPVTWMGHIGEAPDYTIDEVWMNRVAEVVGYAENAGLKAIINIHHDGSADKQDKYNGWLQIGVAANDASVNEATKTKISAVWTQIANKFIDKGEFLIFEGFNEIHDGGWGWGANRNDGGKQYKTFNEWLQVFVDAVRATGGNNATRFLGIPGYDTNADITIANLVLPTDPANRLLVAIHYYDPYEYTLEAKYSQWGHNGASSKCAGKDEEKYMRDSFTKIREAYVEKGISVYLGEVGCVRRSNETDEAFRRYYLEYMSKAAKDNGISLFLWDNGQTGTGRETSGVFDHATGKFPNSDAEAAVKAFVKGYTNTDASYTLGSIYKNAPSSK